MARKVIWANEAVADLEAIAEYIGKDSLYYAAAFVREIRDIAVSLSDLTERGRVVPEINDPMIREILIKNYRLIYKTDTTQTIIIALIHSARDLTSLWEKEDRG